MFGSQYIQEFRESNNQLDLSGKNVLVVGGTGGIGAASAIRFAQLGASVTVAGRNKTNGEAVVAKMNAASPSKDASLFHYLSVDISSIAYVKRFAKDYMELNSVGLNTLLVSSGGLNYGERKYTEDGVEYNFAINYLGRFLVINKLLPLLLKAPEGRAISVLSAGRGGPIQDLDDIQMNKPGAYSKLKSMVTNSMANDFMMEELALRNKGQQVSFFHIYPGVVSTDILNNNNIPLSSILTPLLRWFGTSPEDYAEVTVHIATAPQFGPGNYGLLDQRARVVQPHSFQATPGARERVWNYSASLTGLDKD